MLPGTYPPAMQLAGRDRDPLTNDVEGSTEEGPALRDAATVAARAADDEEAAAAARDRFRSIPVQTIDVDDAIRPHLDPDERVHSLRRRAILSAPGGDGALGYGGTLYLTSRRLVHLGQVVVSVSLTDIQESSLAGERLLLTLRNGRGTDARRRPAQAAACRDGRGRAGAAPMTKRQAAEIESAGTRPDSGRSPHAPDIGTAGADAHARRRHPPLRGGPRAPLRRRPRRLDARDARRQQRPLEGPRVARHRPAGVRGRCRRARALACRWADRPIPVEPDRSATTSRPRLARSSSGAGCSIRRRRAASSVASRAA